jgi:ribosomal protein S18 acetylase RimI-like enzyme
MLPSGWTIRPTTSEDAADLLALVHASDMVAVGFADFDPADVAEALKGPASVVATGPAGEIMAWGYLENSTGGERDFLEVYVHPEGGLPAQRPLLAHMSAVIRERGNNARAGAIPTEVEWIASLENAGFAFLKQYARMQIKLPAHIEPVPGVEVRQVTQEELESFYGIIETAFQDTPDYQPKSFEQWLARYVEDRSIDWDEWLVAVVDGQLAGALQSKAVEQDIEGWVQNLAVLREFRKRGVGRALLAEAFAIYARKGYPEAGLGVDLANPTEAIKLYTGVGMTPAYRANIYEQD